MAICYHEADSVIREKCYRDVLSADTQTDFLRIDPYPFSRCGTESRMPRRGRCGIITRSKIESQQVEMI